MKVIKSPLQRLIVDFLKGKGVSQRKFAEETGVSESAFSTYNRMSSAMGIDLLDEILVKYPDIKGELIKYLSSDTDNSGNDQKHTAATKSDEAAVLRKEMADLRDQLAFLSAQNSDLSANNRKLTELLFSRKVVEQG